MSEEKGRGRSSVASERHRVQKQKFNHRWTPMSNDGRRASEEERPEAVVGSRFSSGVMRCWSDGVLECWSDGKYRPTPTCVDLCLSVVTTLLRGSVPPW